MSDGKKLHKGLLFRKRFKCPNCGQYALLIKRENKYSCINNCRLSGDSITKVIELNDFKDYFTTKQLEDIFGYDFTYKSSVNKDTTKSFYTMKELNELDRLEQGTITFNNLLNDIAIKYFSLFPEREALERELNQFEIFFNLIEDIHISLRLILDDLYLMDITYKASSFQKQRDMLFSINFYYYNLNQHFFEFHEKVAICLGILFGVSFDETPINNSRSNIMRKLKKIETYKNSKIKEIMFKIISNNSYWELNQWRAKSTHNVSEYIKKLNEQKLSPETNRAEIDRNLYHKNIMNIIQILKLSKDLYMEILQDVETKFTFNFDVNAINMIFNTGDLEIFNINDDLYVNDIIDVEYKKNYRRLTLLIKKNINRGNSLRESIYHDMIFRMFEIIKSCLYAIQIDSSDFMNHWKDSHLEQVLDIMDRQYLSYSCAVLIYSCYDKMAVYLSDKFTLHDEKEKIYFENFLNGIEREEPPLTMCKLILTNDAYKFLYNYRNQLVHITRKGAIYLETMPNYEDYLLISCAYNIQMLSKLIDQTFTF